MEVRWQRLSILHGLHRRVAGTQEPRLDEGREVSGEPGWARGKSVREPGEGHPLYTTLSWYSRGFIYPCKCWERKRLLLLSLGSQLAFFFSLNNFKLKRLFLPLFHFLFVVVHKDLTTFVLTYHKGPITRLRGSVELCRHAQEATLASSEPLMVLIAKKCTLPPPPFSIVLFPREKKNTPKNPLLIVEGHFLIITELYNHLCRSVFPGASGVRLWPWTPKNEYYHPDLRFALFSKLFWA